MKILKFYEETRDTCEGADVYYDGDEWLRTVFNGKIEWERNDKYVQYGRHERFDELERKYQKAYQKLLRNKKLNNIL